VDESLQRWCRTSLDVLRDHLSRSNRAADISNRREVAERAVEAAAFLACTRANRIHISGMNFSCQTEVTDLIPSLVSTCPTRSIETPESLGSIHEYLVASRELWAAKRAVRSAKARKLDGIFYTPQLVIDYIVEQTLGPRLLPSKTDQFPSLTILDPAAGCGAFLVAAFRYLLNRYREWCTNQHSSVDSNDILPSTSGPKLTYALCEQILLCSIHGVDLDSAAMETTRRILWLTMLKMSAGDFTHEQSLAAWDRLTKNLKCGHSLLGRDFLTPATNVTSSPDAKQFDWPREYPQIADHGGFDLIVGNPPYRRELHFKRELDQIAASTLGQFREARMDLWYYFVHRGIALLKQGGTLSFITTAYWLHGAGADKLTAALQDGVHLDELFLLRDQPIFHGVTSQHVIFRLTKRNCDAPTRIKAVPRLSQTVGQVLGSVMSAARFYMKEKPELFQARRLDVWPSAKQFLEKMSRHPGLVSLGSIRQGIAENPATINRRTIERFRQDASENNWIPGDGVFSLTAPEVQSLHLDDRETRLLRPYHDLCDLGRYWAAAVPSRQLIYSTRHTCPDIAAFPRLHQHLHQYRRIMESRRETKVSHNQWWHLHWPREERIWNSPKLVVLQMAKRPSFSPAFGPMSVSFSVNVFLPAAETREDLRYLCGLLNSRVLWAWLDHHAKHRGIGLELNGYILQQAPIRRIDFANSLDVERHDQLVSLVDERIAMECRLIEESDAPNRPTPAGIDLLEDQIDNAVATLYGLDSAERQLADEIIGRERG